jgi:hypothetical protein
VLQRHVDVVAHLAAQQQGRAASVGGCSQHTAHVAAHVCTSTRTCGAGSRLQLPHHTFGLVAISCTSASSK